MLFVNASNEFMPGKSQSSISDEQIMKIVDAVRTRAVIERYSALVTYEQIRDNDFNLNISRFVNLFEQEDIVDVNAVQIEIETLEAQLARVRLELSAHLTQLGVR